ncbi:uncharacterized protein [Ptychodera flava]|uniref:uncharacterized protein n=1 Tax=Ptychodera flava TaxID=63121 RepID=UPI00396A1A51
MRCLIASVHLIIYISVGQKQGVKAQTPACLTDEVAFGGSCYFVESFYDVTRKDFEEATAECAARGAYLVAIQSDGEKTFLSDHLANHNKNGKNERYWTSATDNHTEGTWRWDSGHVWSYDGMWNPLSNPPNDGEFAGCGIFAEQGPSSAIYSLEDLNCESKSGYICERGNWPTCEYPPVPDYGSLTTSPSFPVAQGSSVTYQCDAGYQIAGDAVLECIEASPDYPGDKWNYSIPLPRCVPEGSCPDPGTLSANVVWGNPIIPFPVEVGTTLNYDCEEGFSLIGSPVLECMTDGIWDYSLPSCTALENIAFNKTATQSSTDYGGVASLAVDGDVTGDFSGGSCTHTVEQTDPWWQVDLAGFYDVDTIVITNRNENADRLAGAKVFVSPYTNGPYELCGIATSGRIITIDCPAVNVAKFLTIKLEGNDLVLSLCEVQIFGYYATSNPTATQSPSATHLPFGPAPPAQTGQCNLDSITSTPNMVITNNVNSPVTDGSIVNIECEDGFGLVGPASLYCDGGVLIGGDSPTCLIGMENLAVEEHININRVMESQSSRVLGSVPTRVIDGVASTCTQTDHEYEPWFRMKYEVPLDYLVQYVVLTAPYFDGVTVRAGPKANALDGGQVCGQNIVRSSPSTVIVECDPPAAVSEISMSIPGKNATLNLCEVQVMGRIPPVTTEGPTSHATTIGQEMSASFGHKTTSLQYIHQTSVGPDTTTARVSPLSVTTEKAVNTLESSETRRGTKQRESTTMQATSHERMTLEYGKTNEVNQPGESNTLKPTTEEQSATKRRRSTIGFKTTEQAATDKRKSTNQKGNTDQIRSDITAVVILEFIAMYIMFYMN